MGLFSTKLYIISTISIIISINCTKLFNNYLIYQLSPISSNITIIHNLYL